MDNENFGVLVFGYILGIVCCVILNSCYFKNTYKDGQIDAINGIIQYELKVNKDKTSSWVYKDVNKD